MLKATREGRLPSYVASRAASGAVSAATYVPKLAFSLVMDGFSNIVKHIYSGLTGLLRFSVTLPGHILKGFLTMGGGILHTLSSVATEGARVLSGGLVGAIGVVGAAVGAVSLIATKAVRDFSQLGRSIRDLSANTGMGFTKSGGLLNRFSALGVDRKDASGMFGQNPMLFGIKAGVWGLPDASNPQFAASLATRYQGMQAMGPFGALMARNMLGTLGMDNEAGRRVASMPVRDIQNQLGFQSRVQSTLGVDPAVIARTSQQFDLLTGRLKILGENALTRLAAEVLPRVNAGLEVLTNHLANNAGASATLISKGVNAAFSSLIAFGGFMLKLPEMFFTAGSSVLSFAAAAVQAVPRVWDTMLVGISVAQAALQPLFTTFASGFDFVVQMLGNVHQGVGTTLTLLQTGFDWMGKTAVAVFQNIETALDSLYKSDFVQTVIKAIPAGKAVLEKGAEITKSGGRVGKAIGNEIGGESGGALGELIGAYLTGRLLISGGKGLLGIGAKGLLGLGSRGATSGSGVLMNALKGLLGRGGTAAGGQLILPGTTPTLIQRVLGQFAAPTARGLLSGLKMPVVGAGLLLGGFGYTALQRSGALGKNAPGFMEAVGNTYARLTGGDVTEADGYTRNHKLDMELARRHAAKEAGKPVMDRVRDYLQVPSFSDAWRNAQQNPGSWAQGYNGLPGAASGYAQMLGSGVNGWWNQALAQGQQKRGSWAQGVDNGLGGLVRGASNEGVQSILHLQRLFDEQRQAAIGNNRSDQLLEEIARLLRGIQGNTRPDSQQINRMEKLLTDFAARVISNAMGGYAQNAALGTLRMGY